MLTAIKNAAGEMCLVKENPYLSENVSYGDDNVGDILDFEANNPPVPISGFTLSEGEKVEEGEVNSVKQQNFPGMRENEWETAERELSGGGWRLSPNAIHRDAYILIPAKEEQKDSNYEIKVEYFGEAGWTALTTKYKGCVTQADTDTEAIIELVKLIEANKAIQKAQPIKP